MIRNGRARLKASVGRRHGMQLVDLFVDHTPDTGNIRIIGGYGPITMSDHLKLILTPFACSDCGSQNVTSSYRPSMKQWLLKFSGRKIFLCSDCGATQVVKVRRCEWETIGTFAAIAVAFLALTLHWAFR